MPGKKVSGNINYSLIADAGTGFGEFGGYLYCWKKLTPAVITN